MVSIDEELEAAEAAKAAINALLTATPKSAVAATLRKANTAVLLNFSGGAIALNEARKNVEVALSDLFHGPLKQQKIEKAKDAVEEWINRLRAT
jgi:hypothetical protein